MLALGANPSAAETSRAQPFHLRVYGADAPVAVQEVAFDARRHGACALAALHGALNFRPAARDDLRKALRDLRRVVELTKEASPAGALEILARRICRLESLLRKRIAADLAALRLDPK